jgi:ribosomal protein S18 acetylase RimI-like enzyme
LDGNRAFRDCIIGSDEALRARCLTHTGGQCASASMGVPCAWFTDWWDNDRCFHTPADTMEFVDIPRLASCVPAIEGTVRRLSAARAPFFRFIRAGRRLVRPARHSDIPAICEVTRLSFGPMATARMRQEFLGELLGGKEWHVHKNEEVERFVRRHTLQTVACECEGQVVGYATYSLNPEQGLADIGNNAVHPDWQGQGIGQLLLHEVRQRILDEGYTKSQVTALSNNPAALRIYEKLGYKPYAQSTHCLLALGKGADNPV